MILDCCEKCDTHTYLTRVVYGDETNDMDNCEVFYVCNECLNKEN